jgi:hypothetical protein
MFVLASLLFVGLAGCASSADTGVATAGGDKTTSSSAKPESEKEAALKFARCMRENGVPDFPDPEFDENGGISLSLPGGVDPTTVDAAQEKCKQYLPNGGEPEQMSPEDLEKQREYSKCMRDNGVPEFPDPDANGGIRIEGGPGLDPQSPEFKAADEKCKQLLPGGGRGGSLNSKEEG